MDHFMTPGFGPLVAVYGLVGDDENIILVRAPDASTYRLPGGAVRAGESVVAALRRAIREQLDAELVHVEFCAAVEHRVHTDPTLYELALVFDGSLAEQSLPASSRLDLVRIAEADVGHLDVRPLEIAERLRDGTLSVDHPWWPVRM